MSRGMPSMVALLGLLAVAGYQNRDKLSQMLGGLDKSERDGSTSQGGLGGVLSGLGGLLGGATAGSVLSGGIGDLVDHFKRNGQGEAAESWIKRGPNQELTVAKLEQALGPEVLDTLVQHTGQSREQVLSRLTQALPETIDKYTPEGRIPTPDEASRLVPQAAA